MAIDVVVTGNHNNAIVSETQMLGRFGEEAKSVIKLGFESPFGKISCANEQLGNKGCERRTNRLGRDEDAQKEYRRDSHLE